MVNYVRKYGGEAMISTLMTARENVAVDTEPRVYSFVATSKLGRIYL